MSGWRVMTQELHTGRPVAVVGFYPRTRKQLRRAEAARDAIKTFSWSAWVEADDSTSHAGVYESVRKRGMEGEVAS